MAVDLGSRPFSTVYRPFRGSSEWVRIEWFPCAPGAKDLPFESNITNPFWERDQYEFEDGEEPLEEVIPTGKPRVKPGTGKGHVCGTEEDFRDGGLYLPDEPPVLYGMLGLPACCNAPVVMRGGVEDRGSDVVTPVPGLTCETAGLWPLGVLVTITRAFDATVWWFRHPVAAGKTYRYTVNETVPLVQIPIYTGPDCLSLTLQYDVVDTGVYDVLAPADDYVYLQVFGNTFGVSQCTVLAEELP